MSKTHKHPRSARTDSTPDKAIDRLRMMEAKQEIKEATQEAQRVHSDR